MERGSPLRGRRLLVVEDAYLLARDYCDWLEGAGASVIGPEPTSETALALLAGEPGCCDAALIDIDLGQGPRFDLVRALAGAGIPTLIATGYDLLAIPPEFAAVPRLQKPFRADQLLAALAALPAPAAAAPPRSAAPPSHGPDSRAAGHE
ncbi:hypothetical protein [Sphingomonas ginkgonis]|uniref:hypothetical protein n=1 Tax=Sphingomonas ginkgonis TaxID=2315330 RepID=UPI0016397215|nr:hypothetical protein [Sphingomonas ginkgonis]